MKPVDIYLMLRESDFVKSEAVRLELPSSTRAYTYFSERFNIIVIPDPPYPPPLHRGWKWYMYLRDIQKWGRLMAHEIRHVREGHFHKRPSPPEDLVER